MDACWHVIEKATNDPTAKCYISPTQRSAWKKYVDFTKDFCRVYDYDPDLFVLNAKKGAVEPLLSYKPDSEVYITTCRQIAATLKSRKGVTRKAVISFMGMAPKTQPLVKSVELNPTLPHIVPHNSRTSDAAKQNQDLIASLNTPQLRILREIMEKEGKDNEYAALVYALKFWKNGGKE